MKIVYSTEFKSYLDEIKDEILKAKFFRYINMLKEKGSLLHRPYADYLNDGIYELRVGVNRALYFFTYKDYIIISHSFEKRTDKVPESETIKAKKFRDEFLSQFPSREILEKYVEEL